MFLNVFFSKSFLKQVKDEIIMEYRIATIDPLTDRRWDDFVLNSPKSSVYHHSAWIDLIASTFPYSPSCYALIEKETDILKGLLPFMVSSSLLKRGHLVSLPYASYCDPLVPIELLGVSLDYAIQNHRAAPRVELKLSANLEEIPPPFERENLFVNHTVDLNAEIDVLFEKLHKSCVRRKIKKAHKNKLKLRFSDSEKDIKEIYALLLSSRKTKGLPPHPYKFFLNMWKILAPLDMFFAPYVTYGNKIISVAIILKFKDTIYYEYGASDPAYHNLGSNQFLLWEIMKFGNAKGAKSFDLGRTHSENRSLIEFKDRLGGESKDLTYYYYPKRTGMKLTNGILKTFGTNLNKRLPNLILRLEGEFVYRVLR